MELRLEIEKLVSKGDGLARDQGKTIFVSGALPGETVLAETIEDKGDYSRAEVVEIVTASPDRVIPACPHYGVCGGCDMQHATTEAQAIQKFMIVKENLLRIGGIDTDSQTEGITTYPIASAQGWGYRTRVKFHVDLEQKKAGFLGRKSIEQVVGRETPFIV
jgi:23S rRNA (uracil1939-C5)-methyltransferase